MKLNTELRDFWSKAHGWAPHGAAELMVRSRLDWQVELSVTLRNWSAPFPTDVVNGLLIIAWAHLGALVEGTLKLFLAVYLDDYKRAIEAPKDRKGSVVEPDELATEKIRVFIAKKQLLSDDALALVATVQQRRNAIHAFRTRSLGTESEWRGCLASYLELLREVNRQLPYPDDLCMPRD